MCLRPKNLRNNSTYFSLSSFGKRQFEVPCMECAECKQMIQNEWFVRNYWQSQDTWRKGGYVLFDTLTYDDKHVPHISDFTDIKYTETYFDKDGEKRTRLHQVFDYMCFNHAHFQSFMKMLKQRLEREGYDPDHNLRFFMASEYGTDPNRTHRPHYHVLFYVTDNRLDPCTLSHYINECWKHGLTDGVDRHGRAYVLNNTFGEKYVKDPARLNGCMHYVTKYVVKDSDFQKNIDCRIHEVVSRVMKYKYADDHEAFLKAKSDLRRQMNQFHRQSINFGYSLALQDQDTVDSIWKDGTMPIPDKQKIKKFVPIPMYYLRKMFQEQYKLEDGSLHWKWTEDGLRWKHKMMYKSVKKVVKKFEEWQINVPRYVDEKQAKYIQEKIQLYLAGRSWKDFARYLVFYRGRYNVELSSKPSIGLVLNKSLINDQRIKLGKVTLVYHGSYNYSKKRMEFSRDVVNAVGGEVFIPYDKIDENFTIDESSFPEFHDFDKLFKLYCANMVSWSKRKQEAYDRKQDEYKKLKALGMRPKMK